MSSIYPLGMSWPGEAGFSMDTTTTATLVIGGCVGEAVVPLIIGVYELLQIDRHACMCDRVESHTPPNTP